MTDCTFAVTDICDSAVVTLDVAARDRQVTADAQVLDGIHQTSVLHGHVPGNGQRVLVSRKRAIINGEVASDRNLLGAIYLRIIFEGQVMAGGDLCCLFRLDVAQGNIAL